MGCGFVAVVPAEHAEQATSLLAGHHPGSRRIGTVTATPGVTVHGLSYR
jgi:phosphoribosylformylglycinamidine cyclo-ligase